MTDIVYAACGLICNDCPWYKGEKEPQCPGCEKIEGKPFWGTCETYKCAIEHGVDHCGLCNEFPCDGFMGRYDPSTGPENAVLRAGLLAYRARHGDEKAIELTRKVDKVH